MRPSSRLLAGPGALLLVALGASGVAGQEGCEFVPPGNDLVVNQSLPGIGRVSYITRPHFSCAGGIEILADSAVAYTDRGMSDFIGRVRFLESTRELRADEARYFSNEARLQAEGHMSIRDEGRGSVIDNGDLVYLLVSDFREQESMTVTTGADGVRPRARLTPPAREPAAEEARGIDVVGDTVSESTTGAPDEERVEEPEVDSVVGPPPEPPPPADTLPPEPYTVESDQMFLVGGGSFTAVGRVEITRDSLYAFADSAVYDLAAGGLDLEGSARVQGTAYQLFGRRITMGSPESAETEVHALRDARLLGDGFQLDAARIGVFLRDDRLRRLVATPWSRPGVEESDSTDAARPKALVEDFVLTADSLEILAPEEAIERVFAAGHARSESSARDTLNVDGLPEIARHDWLEGDTVIVSFVPAPGAESASDVDVDAITAIVGARSLYRLPPNDSTAVPGTDAPAVHYVTGNEIRIEMDAGEVVGMQVTGRTRGVHFEPLRRPTPRDTTAIPPDTSLSIDSTRATPDTGSADTTSRGTGRAPAIPATPHTDPARWEESPWIRR